MRNFKGMDEDFDSDSSVELVEEVAGGSQEDSNAEGDAQTSEASSDDDDDDSSDSSDDDDDDDKQDNSNAGEQEDDDDDIVRAFKNAQEVRRDKPPDIHTSELVADISFHPEKDLIAAASFDGDIFLYEYSMEKCELKETVEAHNKECRCVEFSEDGDLLYSASKDKSIMVTDVASSKPKWFNDDAHEEPVYTLKVIDENRFATGDDNGTVKLWDLRQKDAILSLKESEETITDMVTNESRRFLVFSSVEGMITTIDLHSRKLHVQSELYECELSSLALVKQDRKLVVGSSKGTYYFFDWGSFGYHSDEFPGPKNPINCMKSITQNIVVTAHSDGVLRATHLFPHKQLGIVGTHPSSTVESMDVSGDGELIATSGFSNVIHFWNIKYFDGLVVSEREKNDKKVLKHNLPSSNVRNAGDFFQDMA
ncbi:WD repeat-containing protein 55 homolog [Cloeon dipterum]|uniref:WD repeat-containing protein 55 homolog n=1 Tax=Cloeon dipterum TaxID=197152 RepID=UPI00321FAE80